MRRNLEDLRLVNRHWGGSRALERHLESRVRALGDRPIRILDVGAGSGDVASRLQLSLRASGYRATVVALDLQWRHLRAGRSMSHDPPCAVAADVFHLPFDAGAFDFAVSTLFFHHFSPEENQGVLREMSRVARYGLALLDLTRHRLPALFVSLAGRLLFQSRVSVADGIASVQQAYTVEEALRIAGAAARPVRARRIFPFRWLLTTSP
jgi:ubiquinone/menaquinone biosynthesis C-methylase UbiE